MKLRRAKIENFRLLKELELDFSTSKEKPLTVIRAANETGKTTCETALLWGLYGSDALPGGQRGKNYPLYPADTLSQGVASVKVSVEIEFEMVKVLHAGRPSQVEENKVYRVKRECTEIPSKDGASFERRGEYVYVFEVTSSGLRPESVSSEAQRKEVIESAIPRALKDIYFTDGDAAMSFIEAAASTGVKRQRVRGAIEALLGLNVLERSIKHLNGIAKKLSAEIDDTDYAAELDRLNTKIEFCEGEIEEWKSDLENAEKEFREAEDKLRHLESKIEEILKLGDREALTKKKVQLQRDRDAAKEAGCRALGYVSDLLRSSDLAAAMISEIAQRGLSILDKMSQDKKLPKANVPILEELLVKTRCFCGESLDDSNDDGRKRRNRIEAAITDSLEADALSEAATSLYYSVRSKRFGDGAHKKWIQRYTDVVRNHADANTRYRDADTGLSEIDEEIDKIQDASLEVLKENKKILRDKRDKAQMNISSATTKLDNDRQRHDDFVHERSIIEKKLKRSGVSTAKLDTARLASSVMQSVFDRMRKEEVGLVSKEMNRIFLEMIGSRPEANDLTIIKKSELTREFDIKVYGPDGHMLNPDSDLNGASRRAITLAFILAITKVSKVEAPNVIDTPLGMMAGYVKQSVLLQTIKEGTQTILFLTHDEIMGVEDVIDRYAGKVFTLTNPAHYPNMLVHRPEVEDIRIIGCECDHRHTCNICERKSAPVE